VLYSKVGLSVTFLAWETEMAESVDAKRERILKTAVQLFGKEGYYGTRMSEVASKARVSPKTLYKFFKGKKELFISARGYATNRLLVDSMASIPQGPGVDSFNVVESILKSYSGFIRQNRGLARILAEAVVVADPEIRKDEQEGFAYAVKAFTRVFEEDIKQGKLKLAAEPDEIAWLFLSFAYLIAYAVLLDLDKDAVGGFEPEFALELFFGAMRKPD
jgi:AcrR family transcriptional regulator